MAEEVEVDAVRSEVLSWWLKKVLLPFLGKRFPAFLATLLDYLELPRHGKEIILLRYSLGKDWKEIGPMVGLEDRQVFSVHKKCIEKLISP